MEAQARDCSLWVCTCVALGMQVWVRPGCWTHGKDTSPENTKWTLGPLAGPGHVPERALGASLNTDQLCLLWPWTRAPARLWLPPH